MPKVSFVTPIYNAENFLGKSINAILNQTVRDLELILVNDGSTDNSLEICRNYERLDERVHIISIPNGGVSNARNTGMKAARGEYIQFLDSDDTIDPLKTEKLLEAAELYQADLVICGIKIIQDNKLADVLSVRKYGQECVFHRENFLKNLPRLVFETSVMEGVNSKLYRRTIIEKHGILYPTKTSYGEDFLFNFEYFRRCGTTAFIAQPYYNYILHDHPSLSQRYIDRYFENQKMLIEEMQAMLEEEEMLTPEGLEYIYTYGTNHIISCLRMLLHKDSTMTKAEQVASMIEIVNSPFTQCCLPKAKYLDPKYAALYAAIQHCDIKGVMWQAQQHFGAFAEDIFVPEQAAQKEKELLLELALCDDPEYVPEEKPVEILPEPVLPLTDIEVPAQEMAAAAEPPVHPGFVNRGMQGCMRLLQKVFPEESFVTRKATAVERNLKTVGVKTTLKKVTAHGNLATE